MHKVSTKHQSEVYGILKLYEVLVRLCFGVKNMQIVSTEVDDLYVYLGLRDALDNGLKEVATYLPKKLPKNLLPKSISGMTNSEYMRLQGYFGPIKTYAKAIKAHCSTISPDIQLLIDDAEKIQNGESITKGVLLSKSDIGTYNYNTKTLSINNKPIEFSGGQEDYFLWVMFQQEKGVSISWDELRDAVIDEFQDEQVFSNGRESMRQAMHRINRKVRERVTTNDNLFSYQGRGFKRSFGPQVTH